MLGKYNEMQSWITIHHKIARKIVEITNKERERENNK